MTGWENIMANIPNNTSTLSHAPQVSARSGLAEHAKPIGKSGLAAEGSSPELGRISEDDVQLAGLGMSRALADKPAAPPQIDGAAANEAIAEAKSLILSQSGMNVLGHANKSAQAVLSLIK